MSSSTTIHGEARDTLNVTSDAPAVFNSELTAISVSARREINPTPSTIKPPIPTMSKKRRLVKTWGMTESTRTVHKCTRSSDVKLPERHNNAPPAKEVRVRSINRGRLLAGPAVRPTEDQRAFTLSRAAD